MKARLIKPALLLFALLAGAGTGAPDSASADHSGVLQLNDRAGPYVLMAWTEPRRPRTDWCQVTVTVLTPGSYRPVPGVVVRVIAERPGGATVSVSADRGRDPNGINHVADLTLPSAGRWTVTVRVSGAEGAGSADFPLDVEAPSWGAWPAILGAGAALLGLATVWLLRRARSRGPAEDAVGTRTDRPGGTSS